MPKVCVEFDCNGTPGEPVVRTFATTVGDGSSVEFDVNHNLGTRDVTVQAYDLATGEVRQDVSVFLMSATQARLRFDVAPLANGTRVLVHAFTTEA